MKKTILNTAIVTALGVSGMTATESALADTIDMSFNGLMTFLYSDGSPLLNTDGGSAPWYRGRTPISGSMTYDTVTNSGSLQIVPFSFLGSGDVTTDSTSFTAIGDGFGNPGSLILGNMGFNWSGNLGIPLSIVWDAAGLFNNIQSGVTSSQTIAGVGALSATENLTFGTVRNNYTLTIGPSPIATTTFNTTNIGIPTLGTNPSGTLPLTDDGIGGSPFQQSQPLKGFNMTFDITSIHIDQVSAVPVPGAVWLFGSGLAGLVSIARRRRLNPVSFKSG